MHSDKRSNSDSFVGIVANPMISVSGECWDTEKARSLKYGKTLATLRGDRGGSLWLMYDKADKESMDELLPKLLQAHNLQCSLIARVSSCSDSKRPAPADAPPRVMAPALRRPGRRR